MEGEQPLSEMFGLRYSLSEKKSSGSSVSKPLNSRSISINLLWLKLARNLSIINLESQVVKNVHFFR